MWPKGDQDLSYVLKLGSFTRRLNLRDNFLHEDMHGTKIERIFYAKSRMGDNCSTHLYISLCQLKKGQDMRYIHICMHA